MKLGKKDSAIIFRNDGGTEVMFPGHQNDDDIIEDSAFRALLCITFLKDQELVDMVTARIKAH